MSAATTPKPNLDEIARRGDEIFARVVRPKLTPADAGRFVAIDIDTEDYEIDDDDHTALKRLRGRNPGAAVWLLCTGQPATYLLRAAR